MRISARRRKSTGKDGAIRIGYVPMTDCAPLIAAYELKTFAKRGLNIKLCREAGWATVREKMLHEELDAAHAPASMAIEMSCGIGSVPVPSLTGLVTALNGNAITLSDELWDLGVRDAASLKRLIVKHKGGRKFTFAGVLKFSSQHYLMRKWLRSGGIDPDTEVNIAVVPPPLIFSNLEKGFLDGYCVAEPWSSIGALQGIGWCVALTCDLDPFHIEKIFMVRRSFDEERHDEHVRLIAALIEAAAFCDNPENRSDLAEMLARPEYLNISKESLRNLLVGPFDMGKDRSTDATNGIIYHRHNAGDPTLEKARWVLNEINANGLVPEGLNPSTSFIKSIFRSDLYREALELLSSESTAMPSSSLPISDAIHRNRATDTIEATIS